MKYFVRTIGYEPVLSDDGDVFYNPGMHTHDSCLSEVGACQMFVLVVGGRYGGLFNDSQKSITNHEYRQAVANKIPVFALVDQAVYADHHLYTNNRDNDEVPVDRIRYPASDSVKIFQFIDEVRRASVNNAVQPFRNYSDIEAYLKKQWAGMMFDFLAEKRLRQEAVATNKLLESLTIATKKTEELVKLLVSETGDASVTSRVEDIGNKVEADHFAESVLSGFNVDRIKGLDAERYDVSNPPAKWTDFCLSLPGFYVEYMFDEDEQEECEVLFGPASTGFQINGADGPAGKRREFERGYEGFLRAGEDVRRGVLRRLAGSSVTSG